jgi:hypothetical protein
MDKVVNIVLSDRCNGPIYGPFEILLPLQPERRRRAEYIRQSGSNRPIDPVRAIKQRSK